MSDVEQRLAALTEDDVVGPSEFYDDYERQLHSKLLRLGESDIHGVGVFAKVELPKGTCIGAAHGPHIVTESRESPYLFMDPSLGTSVPERLIELTGPLRFLNGSDEPNVVFHHWSGRTRAFTNVDVDVGEELLMDYKQVLMER